MVDLLLVIFWISLPIVSPLIGWTVIAPVHHHLTARRSGHVYHMSPYVTCRYRAHDDLR